MAHEMSLFSVCVYLHIRLYIIAWFLQHQYSQIVIIQLNILLYIIVYYSIKRLYSKYCATPINHIYENKCKRCSQTDHFDDFQLHGYKHVIKATEYTMVLYSSIPLCMLKLVWILSDGLDFN